MSLIFINDKIFISNDLGPPSTAEILMHIENLLREVDAKYIEREGNMVHFRGGIVRYVYNWNILIPIDSGAIFVSDSESGVLVTYNLRLATAFIISVVMSASLACLSALQFEENWIKSIVLGFFGVCWLFGAHYAITWFRFPRWLGDGLQRLAHIRAP